MRTPIIVVVDESRDSIPSLIVILVFSMINLALFKRSEESLQSLLGFVLVGYINLDKVK